MVQPTGGQEALLQEARETDEPRGGAPVQGGTPGEWATKNIRARFFLRFFEEILEVKLSEVVVIW